MEERADYSATIWGYRLMNPQGGIFCVRPPMAGEHSDVGRTQLNNEIISGYASDIFDLSDINVASYISKGILTDFYLFLDAGEEVARDDRVSGILGTYTQEDILYGIPLGYRFNPARGTERQWRLLSADEVVEAIEAVQTTKYTPTFCNNEQALRYVIEFMHIAAVEYFWKSLSCHQGMGLRVLRLYRSRGSDIRKCLWNWKGIIHILKTGNG